MPTSTTMTNLSQNLSLENNSDNLRDVSLSSYMNTGEETLAHKPAESSPSFFPKAATREGHHDQSEGAGKGHEEIGVFSAEKYFKGVMDNDISPRITNAVTRRYRVERDELSGAAAVQSQIPVEPPSIGSESNWNSQSALIKSVLRHPPGTKTNKARGKSILAGLGCKYCSCSDKDSVDVHEHDGEISFKRTSDSGLVQAKEIPVKNTKDGPDVEYEPRSESWKKEEIHGQLNKLGYELNKETCFSFPTLSSAAGKLPMKMQQQHQLDLFPRKSIEVFGSPANDRGSKSFSLERRLTMLSWDANPGVGGIAYSETPSGVHYENDSDASSDLFEIESHTGRVKPLLKRQGSDATSGCVSPTTCYAPSEASIDWSVVTGSAADFSVLSDYEDLRPSTSPVQGFNVKTKTCRDTPKRRPSPLLGCKNNAAVRVAGDAHRRNNKTDFDQQTR